MISVIQFSDIHSGDSLYLLQSAEGYQNNSDKLVLGIADFVWKSVISLKRSF